MRRTLLAVAFAGSRLLAQEPVEDLAAIRRLLASTQEDERSRGLQRLTQLGEAGAAALSDLSGLLERLADEERALQARGAGDSAAARARRRIEPQRSAVLRVLGGLGPPAAPVLLPWLDHPSERLRRQAAASLARTRPPTRDVLALARPGDEARRLVVLDVVRLLPHEALREAAPFVVAALDAPHPSARQAAMALLESRRHDRAALDLLRARMLGGDGPGRLAATLLCASVAGRPITIESFEAGMQSLEAPTRALAATLVARLGEQARRAIPALIAAVDDADPDVQLAAMRALEPFGPSAAAVAPALARRLGDQHPSTPGLAILLAARIGGSGLPLLRDAMRHDSYVLRRQAVSVLPQLDAGALPAVLDVMRLAKTDHPDVAAAAILALGQLPPSPEARIASRVLATIRDGLTRGPAQLEPALRALLALRSRAAPLVPDLITLLERSADRQALGPASELAVQVLGAIGPQAHTSVPVLSRFLDETSRLAPAAMAALAEVVTGLAPEPAAALLARLDPLLRPECPLAMPAALVLGRLGAAGLANARRLLADDDEQKVAIGRKALAGLARPRPDLLLELATGADARAALAALAVIGHAAERRAEIAAALVEALPASPDRRPAILAALAELGPETILVAPAMLDLLDADPSSAAAAVGVLGAMGEPAVALLLAKLGQDASRDLRLVDVLGRIGAPARAAVPRLAGIVQATDDEVLRALCVTTLPRLGELGLRAAAGLDVPDELLTSVAGALLAAHEPGLRRRGLGLLRTRPALIERHLGLVLHLSRDADPALRELAVRCLAAADRGAAGVKEAIVDARYDHDAKVRAAAEAALEHLPPSRPR